MSVITFYTFLKFIESFFQLLLLSYAKLLFNIQCLWCILSCKSRHANFCSFLSSFCCWCLIIWSWNTGKTPNVLRQGAVVIVCPERPFYVSLLPSSVHIYGNCFCATASPYLYFYYIKVLTKFGSAATGEKDSKTCCGAKYSSRIALSKAGRTFSFHLHLLSTWSWNQLLR